MDPALVFATIAISASVVIVVALVIQITTGSSVVDDRLVEAESRLRTARSIGEVLNAMDMILDADTHCVSHGEVRRINRMLRLYHTVYTFMKQTGHNVPDWDKMIQDDGEANK